jgi:uncharacterized protein (TIGR02246 family)
MRWIFFLVVLFVSSGSFCQEDKMYNMKDLDALHSLPSSWEAYWNSHNMDSLGTMLTEDVDFVNLAGIWLKGKAVTLKLLKQVHQSTFKSSVWTNDSIGIKYIKPDLAILHIGWSIRDSIDGDGRAQKPKHGIFTWVVIKEKGQWQLLAMDNVAIQEAPSSAK